MRRSSRTCFEEREMARTHRFAMTSALVVCLLCTEWTGLLLASGVEASSTGVPSSLTAVNSAPRSRFAFDAEALTENAALGAPSAHVWRNAFHFIPGEPSSFAQRGQYRGRGSGGSR